MSLEHFNLNRPVHLARRDVYFEHAVESLFRPMGDTDTADRISHLKIVLSLLNTSKTHAAFTARAGNATDGERDFDKFLKLITNNVEAVLSMILHQSHLEASESFLFQFLKTTPEQCTLPAQHYRRRSDDLMEGVCNLLRLAYSPYRALQDEDKKNMTPDERARYNKAFDCYQEEINEKRAKEQSESPVS